MSFSCFITWTSQPRENTSLNTDSQSLSAHLADSFHFYFNIIESYDVNTPQHMDMDI